MDLSFYKNLPVFTHQDLEAFSKKNHGFVLLTNLKKQNKIIQIEKGKYTLYSDPLIFASNIIIPSYIGGLSALNYYNLTTQIPLKVLVLTKEVKRDNKHVKFVYIPEKYFFGFEKIKYKDFEIFMVNKEKLLIDSVYFQKLGVSISDLDYLLKEDLNKELLVEYLKKFENLSLIKRVGFLLEENNILLYDEFSEIIKKDKNYIKLDINLPKSSNLSSKWRLDVNI